MSRFRALWKASLNATKKALTWNIEDMMPPSEKLVFGFNSMEEVNKWHLYSDSEYGGLSSASLEVSVAGAGLSGIFSGNLSTDVTEGSRWKINRSGFCGMRSKKEVGNDPSQDSWRVSLSECGGWHSRLQDRARRFQISDRLDQGIEKFDLRSHAVLLEIIFVYANTNAEFNGFIDLDAYDTIAMKLKGDGRCYISTIYTENWVNSPGQQEDNSWQAFVLAPKDHWHIVKIPLDDYLPTWRGNVIDVSLEMNPARIVGMSLSLNAEGGIPGCRTGPGDFRLQIDWIKALRS